MTRVLVADDDDDVRESTLLLLEAYGHEAHAVDDAAGVVEAARGLRPDVLLQDVTMPGLDDLPGLVRAVREAVPGVRVILFTGREEAEELAAQARVDGVVRKPCDMDALERAMGS